MHVGTRVLLMKRHEVMHTKQFLMACLYPNHTSHWLVALLDISESTLGV